jgi:hypothetical protein
MGLFGLPHGQKKVEFKIRFSGETKIMKIQFSIFGLKNLVFLKNLFIFHLKLPIKELK